MFKIGDIISVSRKGICRVEQISKDVFDDIKMRINEKLEA